MAPFAFRLCFNTEYFACPPPRTPRFIAKTTRPVSLTLSHSHSCAAPHDTFFLLYLIYLSHFLKFSLSLFRYPRLQASWEACTSIEERKARPCAALLLRCAMDTMGIYIYSFTVPHALTRVVSSLTLLPPSPTSHITKLPLRNIQYYKPPTTYDPPSSCWEIMTTSTPNW